MASSSSEPELKSEQEVIAVFQDMRKQISGLFNNLHALEAGQHGTQHLLPHGNQLQPAGLGSMCCLFGRWGSLQQLDVEPESLAVHYLDSSQYTAFHSSLSMAVQSLHCVATHAGLACAVAAHYLGLVWMCRGSRARPCHQAAGAHGQDPQVLQADWRRAGGAHSGRDIASRCASPHGLLSASFAVGGIPQ